MTRTTCYRCGAICGLPRDPRPGTLARWYLAGDGRAVCWLCIRLAARAARRNDPEAAA
jgi:hypothetical protein